LQFKTEKSIAICGASHSKMERLQIQSASKLCVLGRFVYLGRAGQPPLGWKKLPRAAQIR
jgi:hypothetical protein